MTDYPWFRYYSETPQDKKFDLISEESGLDYLLILGAWSVLLCVANGSPVRGSLYVTTKKRYSNSYLSKLLRLPEKDTDKLLKFFLEYEMLELDENSAYYIKNFEKRQYKSDSSTARVNKYRANKKKEKEAEDNENCNDGETLHVTFPSVSASAINLNSLSNNYLRIFSGVTNMVAIPGNDPNVYNALDQLINKYKSEEELIDYLKPYYQKWIKTKSKEGKPYSKTNNAWLTTYAIAGEMPGENNIQSKSRQVFK